MISEEQQRQLEKLNEVFLEENTKLNLSAFRQKDVSWVGNILDSISLLEAQSSKLQALSLRIADIGTGGGFPLLPLAVLLPECQFTGFDSVGKKIDAIGRIAERMELSNIDLTAGRLEDVGRDEKYREQFDIVTARAVAPLNVLLEYSSPLVKPDGWIVAWKSMHIETELEESLLARAELSCQLEEKYEYELPGDWGKRQLLFFKKRASVSNKYPREVGVPKKTPLL